MVASVYLSAIMMDRYGSWCCPGMSGDPENYDHGPLARKSGLWGLSMDERRQILNYIFKSSKDPAEAKNAQLPGKKLVDDDVESQKKAAAPRRASSKLFGRSSRSNSLQSRSAVEEQSETPGSDEFSVMDSSELDANSCSICLSSFKPGEELMNGTNCEHIFHRECVFDWLMKHHDECPYCRKEMWSPDQMRQAAEDVLGPRRFKELTRWAPPAPSNDVARDENGDPSPSPGSPNSTSSAAYTAGAAVEMTIMEDRDDSNADEGDANADLEAGMQCLADDESSTSGISDAQIGRDDSENDEAQTDERETRADLEDGMPNKADDESATSGASDAPVGSDAAENDEEALSASGGNESDDIEAPGGVSNDEDTVAHP